MKKDTKKGFHGVAYRASGTGTIDENAEMVWFRQSLNGVKEFGPIVKKYEVTIENPYNFSLQPEEAYHYADGKMARDEDEDEPITIGWLDAYPDIVDDIISRGFDGAITDDGEFIVVFDDDQYKEIEMNKEKGEGKKILGRHDLSM